MARRFSDVNRGGELKLALDNYNTYKTDAATRQTKRLKGGTVTNRPRIIVSIYPFSEAPVLAEAEAVYPQFLVRMGQTPTTGENWAGTELAKYSDATPAGAAAAQDAPKGFRAARANAFDPTGTTADYEQSKFTKLYYVKRPGVTFHYPIGRLKSGLGNDETTVKRSIKASLLTALNAQAYRRLSFSDERAASTA
jgi:hypothetical protein